MRGTHSRLGRQRKKKLLFSEGCGSFTDFSSPRRVWQFPASRISPQALTLQLWQSNTVASQTSVQTPALRSRWPYMAASLTPPQALAYISPVLASSFVPVLQARVISECSLILLLQLPDHHPSSVCIHLTLSPYIKSLYSRMLALALFSSLVIGNGSGFQEAQNFKDGIPLDF